MRHLLVALTLMTACGGSGGELSTLRLAWKGVDGSPRPSAGVAQSFASIPFAFGLRDARADASMVGVFVETGAVVRTSDNVGQYCSTKIWEMLRSAGARLDEPPVAFVETELLEYRVDEAGTFAGLVRLRVTVRRNGSPDWSKPYEGTAKRWGRSHSPDNYNEALSNALSDATTDIVQDDDFARALMGGAAVPGAGIRIEVEGHIGPSAPGT